MIFLASNAQLLQCLTMMLLDVMTILWLLLQLSWLSIWVCPAGLQACTHADDGSGFNGLFHQDNAWHI
jgi:hypothetical protein